MSLFLLIHSSPLFFFFGTEREDILEKEKEDFSHTIWLLCGIWIYRLLCGIWRCLSPWSWGAQEVAHRKEGDTLLQFPSHSTCGSPQYPQQFSRFKMKKKWSQLFYETCEIQEKQPWAPLGLKPSADEINKIIKGALFLMYDAVRKPQQNPMQQAIKRFNAFYATVKPGVQAPCVELDPVLDF